MYCLFKRGGHLGPGQVWVAVTITFHRDRRKGFCLFLQHDCDPPCRAGSESGRDVWLTSALRAAELELSRQLHRQWRLRHVSVSSLGTSVVFSSPPLPALTPRATRNKQAQKQGGRRGDRCGSGVTFITSRWTEGAPAYKLPSVKPEPPVSLGLHSVHIIVNFLKSSAAYTEPRQSEVSAVLSYTFTQVLHLFPKLMWAIADGLTFAGCALAQRCCPAACRLLKMATANEGGGGERVVFFIIVFFFYSGCGLAFVLRSDLGTIFKPIHADEPIKLGLTPPNLSGRWTRIVFGNVWRGSAQGLSATVQPELFSLK